MNETEVRAVYTADTITVYQAYNEHIARTAVDQQTFVSPPFKRDRMTWIKPSFLWMMYRAGWGTKENQEHILAIDIKRTGFEWALQNSCLSHFDSSVHTSFEAWRETLKNLRYEFNGILKKISSFSRSLIVPFRLDYPALRLITM